MSKILIDRGSLVTVRLQMFYKKQELSLGTGFTYRYNNQNFFITNWHNVTGRNPADNKALHDQGGLPDRLKASFFEKGRLDMYQEVDFPIYSDAGEEDSPQHPIWLEHPRHGSKVDVVAIPFSPVSGMDVECVNEMDTTPDMLLQVSNDVFVLGYPKGISGGGLFPIWKRASVATEPDVDLDGLPKVLIDTATREGMSGAPVIAKRQGGYLRQDRTQILGVDGSRFIGVYSGRLGQGEMEAQLGIVWKVSAINEIIEGKTTGVSSFDL